MTATIIDETMSRKSYREFSRNLSHEQEPDTYTKLNLSFSSINIDDTRPCARDAIFFKLISTHEVQRATCSQACGAGAFVRGIGSRLRRAGVTPSKQLLSYGSLTAYSLLTAHCQYTRSEELPVAPIDDRSIGSDRGSRTRAPCKDALAQNVMLLVTLFRR